MDKYTDLLRYLAQGHLQPSNGPVLMIKCFIYPQCQGLKA